MVQCRIFCLAGAGPRTVHTANYMGHDLVDALADAIAGLDAQIGYALADAPLGVDCIAIQFKLGCMMPRAKLAQLWASAAALVSQIISILPEDAPPVTSDPDRLLGVEAAGEKTVDAQVVDMIVSEFAQKGGKNHG